MAHLDGVYRIYLAVNGTSSALTLDMPPSGDISYAIGAPDDQDPWRNAYQQWKLTYVPAENKYLIKSVGSGLYIKPVHKEKIEDTVNLKSTLTPYAWSIVPEGPTDTFSIRVSPCDFVVTLEGSNRAPGTKTRLVNFKETNSEKRSWIFKKARRSAAERQSPVSPILAALKSGSYRLQNAMVRNYLTQKSRSGPDDKFPPTKGLPQSNNDDQVWELTLQEASGIYLVKNKATGLYLGGDGGLISGERELLAGAQTPVGWDIRQAEFAGQYAIYVPGTSYCVDYLLSLGWDASKEITTQLAPKHNFTSPLERTPWYQSWYFEPVGKVVNATAATDTSNDLAPLKTGSYFIRNSGSRTLLTQQEKLEETRQLVRDPAVVTSNFESDNPFQEWKVVYIPSLKQYAVQSAGSNRWLSSVFVNQENESATATASDFKAGWVIRQSEAKDEFVMQLPGTQQSLTISSSEKKDNEKIYLDILKERPTKQSQRWIFEPLDNGADLQDPNHAADHDKDNGGGGDDVKEPSEADRKKKAEEYLRTKSPALITSKLRSSDVLNVGRTTSLFHDDETHPSTGPVQGKKHTQLAWQHNFDVDPVPGAPNSYTIVHSASGRKLAYPVGPQDGSLVAASTYEASLWEILKEDALDTYIFVAKGTGLVLALQDASDDSPAILKYADGSYDQMWRIPASAGN